MSPEPTDPPDYARRTRAVYDLLNGRDFDAITAMFAPDGVWDVSRWGLGAKSGREAIRRFLEDWFGSLTEYEVRVEQIDELGQGVVLAQVLQIARADSRGSLEVRSTPVFRWQDERIAEVTLYRDGEEARVAAARLVRERS